MEKRLRWRLFYVLARAVVVTFLASSGDETPARGKRPCHGACRLVGQGRAGAEVPGGLGQRWADTHPPAGITSPVAAGLGAGFVRGLPWPRNGGKSEKGECVKSEGVFCRYMGMAKIKEAPLGAFFILKGIKHYFLMPFNPPSLIACL